MTGLDLTDPAIRPAWHLAQRLHAGQIDKGGVPYLGHLERVARRLVALFPDAGPAEIQAALLHDAIEDTAATAEMLRAAGIAPEAVAMVERLTRDRAVPYLDWIRALAASGDRGALRVKLADNLDNSDPARPAIPGGAAMLRDRYLPARAILERALGRAADRGGAAG
ncbi:HD domain-containing protein [Roseomonas sp. NAR14]|uniref:HD domain-containing protein n=1 Tax=Roseomonas acroporae TaxID=2937791 RepID=A0A9X1Y5V3_9PROT|nr:HD domain-containing protein [Roseomonas acroporae]MCK8784008.1 HD domain-containing protein [Roseomonas acroporae]